MFRMTVPAFKVWIGLIHRAVQSNHALHLSRDLPMAIDTKVRHRGRTPRGAMTGLALPTNFNVGSNTTYDFPGLGIQRPGVVHQPTTRISDSRDGKYGNNG